MASVKYSGLISEIKGKVGGLVFQKLNKSLGVRINPHHNPSTLYYSQVSRFQMSTLAQNWNALTPTLKADWAAKAPTYPAFNRFGDPYVLSGYQLFIRCNRYMLLTGFPIVTTPSPYNPPAMQVMDFDPWLDSAQSWNLIYEGALPASHFTIVFISNPHSVYLAPGSAKLFYAFYFGSSEPNNANEYARVISKFRIPPVVGMGFSWRIIRVHRFSGNYIELNSGGSEFFP